MASLLIPERTHLNSSAESSQGLDLVDSSKVTMVVLSSEEFQCQQSTGIPEALKRNMQTVKVIADNGTTHAPKQLERWLQQLAVVREGKLKFQVFWLLTNASWLDQMEIWISHLQRKRLQPNHG